MQKTFSPARLEAFSDGVLAVIITIMVLELKIPTCTGLSGLRQVVPTLLVYALSFTFIGVYWVNHHQLVGRLKQSNNRILWANLIWLLAVSLVPFFTNYVEKYLDTFSVTVYSGCMLAAGATFLLLRYAVDCQLEREGRISKMDRVTQLKHWGSLGLYVLAMGIARVAPRWALAETAVVSFIWIVPTLGIFGGAYGGEAGGTEAQEAATSGGHTAGGHSR